MKSNTTYLLEWLDTLVAKILNPHETQIHKITLMQAKQLSENTIKETDSILTSLRTMLFSLPNSCAVRLSVRRYHSALCCLVKRQIENNQHAAFKEEHLLMLHRRVLTSTDTLLSFLDASFGTYIGRRTKVSPSRLSKIRDFTLNFMDSITSVLVPPVCDKGLSDIILKAFDEFLHSANVLLEATYGACDYMRNLAEELPQLRGRESVTEVYSVTDELLIRLNFNHEKYIQYFIRRIKIKLNDTEKYSEKLDSLLFYLKSFHQLTREQHLVYDLKNKSLHTVINRWFRKEIQYIKRKISLSIPIEDRRVDANAASRLKQYNKEKITCILSADQMALLLRSLDDLRIITARSLNDVFRTIVPYLSTRNKKDLSFESMRSKSYVAEIKDQRRVAEVLEEMIKKIKSY